MRYCAAGGCGAVATAASGAAAQLLSGIAASHDAVHVVGDWYLRTVPSEADRGRLVGLLRDAVPGFDAGDPARGLCGNGDALKQAFARDYARGDTVYIGGWQFARTELRLCALAAVA